MSALGNRPNIRVNVDALNGFEASDVTELVFSVIESNGTTTRKVPPTEFLAVLTAPNVSQALQQKYSVEGMAQCCAYTEDQLREYLETPPQGIDVRLWRQAQLDNPDPKKLIPVPMIGFSALNTRIKCQEMQAKHQQGRLDSIAGDISKLQKNQQLRALQLLDGKRKQLELGHRVLKVIIGQEITRKRGYTIQPEEENLRIQLEALQAEMSAPTQFKGRLNELLSQVRLQSQASAMSGGCEKYNMDPYLLSDIKALLKQQQDGLHALVGCIKQDIADLNIIEHHGKTI